MSTIFTDQFQDLKLTGSVLFVIPDNFQEDNVFPLGPGYLASVLIHAGCNVESYCMDVFHHSNDELKKLLLTRNFDAVCLGFMGPRFKRGIEQSCLAIKQSISPDTLFIIGGYGPSSCPEYMLRKTKADVAVIGEGEETILEIMMAHLDGSKDFSNIMSVAYLKQSVYVENPRRKTIKTLKNIPHPAWDIFPMEKYTSCLRFSRMTESDRAFPIMSTRGCTDKCSFCFRLDSGIRVRKPEDVIDEMKILYEKYGVTYFYFVDELAVVNKKQILKLLKLIKTELPPIKFRMDCRVTCFDHEIARELKSAGCDLLNIGFETSSQKVLDEMNKRASVTQNIAAAELALKNEIGIGINMIWGLPGDNIETMKNNAEFIKKYNQYDQIRTIRPVTPYPGSPLFVKAVKEGALEGPDDFYEKFNNSDLYMVNFTNETMDKIYEALFEVNSDLIRDHFQNTSQNWDRADDLIGRFRALYFEGGIDFRGPRDSLPSTISDKQAINPHQRSDSATTMGVWDGLELEEGTRLSGM